MEKDDEYKVITNQWYAFRRKTSKMKSEIKRRELFAECADAYLFNGQLNLKQWYEACGLFEHSDLDVEKIFKEIQKNS